MSKLTRIQHKIFGSLADFGTEMGKFGSLKNGTPAYATNAEEIQSLSNWEGGLDDALIGNNSPAKQDINGALHHPSRQLGYLMQQGIPEWIATEAYYIGGFCSYSGLIFSSLQDSNLNNTPSIDSPYWKIYDTNRPGFMIDFASTVAPSGYLICDGSSVLRASYAYLFTAIGTSFGSADGTHFNLPNYPAYTNANDWTTLTYTQVNALSGNSGLGTFSAGDYEYRREFGDILIRGKLTAGTTSGSEVRIPLPVVGGSQLVSANSSVIPSIQSCGEGSLSVVTGGVKPHILVEPSTNYFCFSFSSASYAGLTKIVGTTLASSGNQISFNARIPIQGWTSLDSVLSKKIIKY